MPNNSEHPQYPLRTVQTWLKDVIVTQGEIAEVLQNSRIEEYIPYEESVKLILPSRTLTPEQRIDIYRAMYPLRMIEALEADYPTLANYMGDEFKSLVVNYVEKYPSRSYTLNHLGKHLPQFLKQNEGTHGSELLHDIALIELAISDVIDEEEVEIFESNDLSLLDEQSIENLTLYPVPAFRLLALATNAVEFLIALDNEDDFPEETNEHSFVMIYRKDYSTDYIQLDELEYTILKKIIDGEPIFKALNVVSYDENSSLEELQHRISQYFSNWVRYGIFRSIKQPALS